MSSSVPFASDPPRLVPGRECGSCSMCCKVYNIAEINKPAGNGVRIANPARAA
jgi:hypothetical protein